ncbi:hypothetical protein GYMLUDRAFT_1024980 [Collybiopsis luxurians FD-317 M1]|uniref:Protein kinase domain-containing protein n=1 Tax=Collybiopsis luxurians FD-317 M1 TaxID=944289 RepID=A0A0D0BGC5_9AGAR|nr:hypothetical protein GYMLUDRAFT_1024980 [Collybiopsis luxurians FD-317 M1]
MRFLVSSSTFLLSLALSSNVNIGAHAAPFLEARTMSTGGDALANNQGSGNVAAAMTVGRAGASQSQQISQATKEFWHTQSDFWKDEKKNEKKFQLDRPPWLQLRFDNPKMLTADDKKVFSSELKGLKLQNAPLQKSGTHNRGIWPVAKYAGYKGSPNDLIVKVMPNYTELYGFTREKADDINFGEVKALKAVGDFVAAGTIQDPAVASGQSTVSKLKDKLKKVQSSGVPVVIMKKKEGQLFDDIAAYKNAKGEEKMKFEEKATELVCGEIARIALDKHVFHGGRAPNNYLFTTKGNMPSSVKVVGWGIAFSVGKDAKMLDVYKYCLDTPQFTE